MWTEFLNKRYSSRVLSDLRAHVSGPMSIRKMFALRQATAEGGRPLLPENVGHIVEQLAKKFCICLTS